MIILLLLRIVGNSPLVSYLGFSSEQNWWGNGMYVVQLSLQDKQYHITNLLREREIRKDIKYCGVQF